MSTLSELVAKRAEDLALRSASYDRGAEEVDVEIEALEALRNEHAVSAHNLSEAADALSNTLAYLEENRDGGFSEKDIKSAERYVDQLVSGEIAKIVKQEIRAIAIEARAAQKDEALRAIFKSKVGVIAKEIQADKDHFESRLTPADNVSNMNGKGLVDGGTVDNPRERSAAESYVQAREILVNVMAATERLLSDRKLDLSPITVSAAMEDARQDIAQRNGELTGLSVSYETAVHDRAASIVQNIAKESKAEAKLAM